MGTTVEVAVEFSLTEADRLHAPASVPITCAYSFATSSEYSSDTIDVVAGALKVDLTEGFNETIAPESARFRLGGKLFVDRQGSLYRDPPATTGVGTLVGTLDYGTGIATLNTWNSGDTNAATLESLVTSIASKGVSAFSFRTAMTPLRPSSMNITATKVGGGTLLVVPAQDGTIDADEAQGYLSTEYGLCELVFKKKTLLDATALARVKNEAWYSPDMQFTEGSFTYIEEPVFVLPDTVKYSAVAYSYTPLDADLIGLDPVRLPSDGRVPFIRNGNTILVHRTQTISVPAPTPNTVYSADRVRLKYFKGFDSNNLALDPTHYEVDLVAGTLTLLSGFDALQYTLPLVLEARIEDLSVAKDVQINGDIQLNTPITHDYDEDSYISSVLLVGDIQSRAFNLFSQQTWTSVWSDNRIGNAISPQYNNALSPIATVNKGAIQERWAIVFTSSTTFKCIGEFTGELTYTGSTNAEYAPTNPMNGEPYFTIDALGWGAGWVLGNVLRFNTDACVAPVWAVRTVQQGSTTVEEDEFELQTRIGVNRNRG